MTEQEMMNEALKWQEHIRKLVTATDDEMYHKRSKVFDWLIKQADRAEKLEKQLNQVKKASDFLLFQISLARSKSLINAEFSGEEELYEALEGEKHD